MSRHISYCLHHFGLVENSRQLDLDFSQFLCFKSDANIQIYVVLGA